MAYDPSKWFSYSNLYDNQNNEETADNKKNESEKQSFDYNTSSNSYEYNDNLSSYEQDGSEYDPCSPSINSFTKSDVEEKKNKALPDPRKLDHYISLLQKLIRPLSPDYKRKLPYDVICQLAHSVLDGTVFEIASGLQDIQTITEKNLAEQRNKVITEHRNKKSEIYKRHENDIQKVKNRAHQLVLLEKKHSDEKNNFKQHCEKEIQQLDQKIVLEIDQKVSDQQLTLERAGLPLFFITNNPEEVKLQMYILDFIIKLANC